MAKEIRFAVGSREHVRSSVWRLWANKADLYLAARTTAGLSKISFHKSGICRYAIVSTEPRPPIKAWRRPNESDPGVTVMFSIAVPAFSLKDAYQDSLPPPNKALLLLGPPAPGTKLILRVLLTKSTHTETDLLNLGRSKAVSILGNVQMTSEVAWLVSFVDPLRPDEHEWLADLVRKTKIHLKPGSSPDGINFAYMHSFEGHLTPPAIIDIPLGRGNLDIPSI